MLSTRASVDGVEDRAERHALLVLVPHDRVCDPRDLGLQLVAVSEKRRALGVERGRNLEHGPTQPVATTVVGLDRELRLSGAERQLLPVPRDPGGEQRVLERVLPLGELPA